MHRSLQPERRGTRFLRCRARSEDGLRCVLPVGHLHYTAPGAQWHAASSDGTRWSWREQESCAPFRVLIRLLGRRG